MIMIEIEIKGDFVKPLTVWAANELLDEGIIDFFGNQDFNEIEDCLNHWFTINEDNKFMLWQTKFVGKIKVLE